MSELASSSSHCQLGHVNTVEKVKRNQSIQLPGIDTAREETSGKVACDNPNGTTTITTAKGEPIPITTISTLAVQSGDTRIVLALLQSGEWLELRVLELTPGLVYLGSTLEEATELQRAHNEVLTKLQSKQSPVEDLLKQADQLITTQRPRAEVYAAMAESLGLAWRNLNSHLETRKNLLDLSVTFHTRARQYSDALDAAEKAYGDNVIPTDVESARQSLTVLQDRKRAVLEASMFTLQEAHSLLGTLKALLVEGGTADSRPHQIKTNIEFTCSQIEHYMESLHDRRKFLDGLFTTRRHHLEQCLELCLFYQDLTQAIINLKKVRDDISNNQELGDSLTCVDSLLHEHIRRFDVSKKERDHCIRHVKTSEEMVSSGHYAGIEARSKAYSVLEAANALLETCETRLSLLQQATTFFHLANLAIEKLDEVDSAMTNASPQESRSKLSVILKSTEEAVEAALSEGYGILEITGGKNQHNNAGITSTILTLENRRQVLIGACHEANERDEKRTEKLNSFMKSHDAIKLWLVEVGDFFIRSHVDPGNSQQLAKDFLSLHQKLRNDMEDKGSDLSSLENFLKSWESDGMEAELIKCKSKLEDVQTHWNKIWNLLENRIKLIERCISFYEECENLLSELDNFEAKVKSAKESEESELESEWSRLQEMYQRLFSKGHSVMEAAKEDEFPHLDINRVCSCVEQTLENIARRKLFLSDLHTHYKKRMSIDRELLSLWQIYRQNISKMEQELYNLEHCLCPLLKGDPNEPECLADSLNCALSVYLKAIKKIQEDVESMITKTESLAHGETAELERPSILRSLLQLYQKLQSKASEYQIIGEILIQWCKNIAEIHRSCDKLDKQIYTDNMESNEANALKRELETSKLAVLELLKFAEHEASAIIEKINNLCPEASAAKDISKIKEILKGRQHAMEENWAEKNILLEEQLKKSRFHKDLKVINDQLEDLKNELAKMKGRYGDNLPATLGLRNTFTHFQKASQSLGEQIEAFISTAHVTMGLEDDFSDLKEDLCDLERKWSTFNLEVGESQKDIQLSVEFFELISEAETWFKEGSQLLLSIASESSSVRSPEEAIKLHQKIESFLKTGEKEQANRIGRISSLALHLRGGDKPTIVDEVAQQNHFMLESFNVINENLKSLLNNLRTAQDQRQQQEEEHEKLKKSLVLAQAEAEKTRRAAEVAEEARKVAEETIKQMSIQKTSHSERVEVIVQTEDLEKIEVKENEDMEELETNENFEADKFFELTSSQPVPPSFVTPLSGASVSEGMKIIFECRVDGTPPLNIEWFKDGVSIKSNLDYQTTFDGSECTLSIEETFVEDSALFTCRATNRAGVTESSAALSVKETIPEEVTCAPTFLKKLVDITAHEGSTLQLEASVAGNPLPVISWFKDDICIDNWLNYIILYRNGECALKFEELYLEDSAEYTCKATNDLGMDTTKARLSVQTLTSSRRPFFPLPLNNLMARAGQKFILEAQVSGSPTPSLAWFHNSKPVKETSECKVSFDGCVASLVIKEAFPKNSGKYTLVAKNTAGEEQTTSTVSVKGRIPTETSDSEMASDVDVEPQRPSIYQSLKNIEIAEGEPIRLDCVIVGQPEPEVIWYHDEKPVKESEDMQLLFHGDRCSLVISEALLEDKGSYKVVALNSAGETSTSCFVDVKVSSSELPEDKFSTVTEQELLEPPVFTQHLTNTHVLEGNSVTLKAAVKGTPKPVINWLKDGLPLLSDNNAQIIEEGSGLTSLIIPKALLVLGGQYEVVATNSSGVAKSIAYLKIDELMKAKPFNQLNEPPIFTKLLEDVKVKAGSTVKFEVQIQGIPKPKISWLINDTILDEYEYIKGIKQYSLSEFTPNGYSLAISKVNRCHAGKITIVAENLIGRAVSVCKLTVIDEKDEPSLEKSYERQTTESIREISKIVTTSEKEEITVDAGPDKEEFFVDTKEKKEIGESEETVDSSSVPTKQDTKKKSPARFISPLQGLILREGEKAIFDCVICGYPSPSISWSHNDSSLPAEAETCSEGNHLRLIIPKAAPSHIGRYSCRIENDGGSAQCTCDLVVRGIQFPPVFSKRLQPTIVGFGDRLHVDIDVSGTPDPDIQWTKNSQPIQSNEHIEIKSEGPKHWLVIEEAEESDSGRYGVVASNSAGRAECLADILVSSLPIGDPSRTTIFADVCSDIKKQDIIERKQVNSLKSIVKSSVVDLDSSINNNILEEAPCTLDSFPNIEIPSEAKLLEENQEIKPPQKLDISWPPPPSSENDSGNQKASVEVQENTVSNIVSAFNSIVDVVPLKVEKDKKEESLGCKDEPILQPEPDPEYCSTQIDPLNEDIQLSIKEENCLKGSPIKFSEKNSGTNDTSIIDSDKMEVRKETTRKESNYTEIKKSISTSEKTIVETKVYGGHPVDKEPIYVEPSINGNTKVVRYTSEDIFNTSDNNDSHTSLESNDNKSKKKRESVKEIALRLEESITPMSPDEVPGGIRMFPPKPSPPNEIRNSIMKSQYTSSESRNKDEALQLSSLDDNKFPELKPFPFIVEEPPSMLKEKVPLPPMPKKFVPGSISSNSRNLSDKLHSENKYIHKQINFAPKLNPQQLHLNYEPPSEPSFLFEAPPSINGMRPEVLQNEVMVNNAGKNVKVSPKIPTKDSKMAQNFLSRVQNNNKDFYMKVKQPDIIEAPKLSSINHTSEIKEETSKLPIVKGYDSDSEVFCLNRRENRLCPTENRLKFQSINDLSQNSCILGLKKEYGTLVFENEAANEENSYHASDKRGSNQPKRYWSSSVTVDQKRKSMPVSMSDMSYSDVEEFKMLSKKSWKSGKNLYDVHENTNTTKCGDDYYSKNFVKKNEELNVSSAFPNVLLRSKKSNIRPKSTPSVNRKFKSIPQLEPFPFQINEKIEKKRIPVPPPPKPKKFIPGYFTESDYESDYDGKLHSTWKPYMSDNDQNKFRSLNLKLQPGRHKKPKDSSPPAPSQFEIPLQNNIPLRPTVSLSDLSIDTTSVNQKDQIKKSCINKAKQFKKIFTKNIPTVQTPSLACSRKTGYYSPVEPENTKKVHDNTGSSVKFGLTNGLKSFTPNKLSSYIINNDLVPYSIKSVKDDSSQKKVFLDQNRSLNKKDSQSNSTSFSSNSYQNGFISHIPSLEDKKLRMNQFRTSHFPPREFEESGYTADTETTLPRRSQKCQSFHESSSSAYFSQSKSYSSNYSSFTNEHFGSNETIFNKSFNKFSPQNNQTSYGNKIGDGFPYFNNEFDSYVFSTSGNIPYINSRDTSSIFSSSEKKSSKFYSTKTEEFFEKHFGPPELDMKSKHKPRFEEFMRENKGTSDPYGPYSDNTYYSMSDESEIITDKGKTVRKVNKRSESHTECMSDEKSEYYSFASDDNKKNKSRIPDKNRSATSERYNDLKANEHFRDSRNCNLQPEISQKENVRFVKIEKEEISPLGNLNVHKLEQDASTSKHSKDNLQKIYSDKGKTKHVSFQTQVPKQASTITTKDISSSLVKDSTSRADSKMNLQTLDRQLDTLSPCSQTIKQAENFKALQSFPLTSDPSKLKKEKLFSPQSPSNFFRHKMRESDYKSDFESHIKPKWASSDSDAENLAHIKSEIPITTVHTKFEKSKPRTSTASSAFDEPFAHIDESNKSGRKVKQCGDQSLSTSFQYVLPKKITLVDEKILAKKLATKESSPPLPLPGTPPEIGFIEPVKSANTNEKEINNIQSQPSTFKTTEQTVYDRVYKEEKIYRSNKIETTKTICNLIPDGNKGKSIYSSKNNINFDAERDNSVKTDIQKDQHKFYICDKNIIENASTCTDKLQDKLKKYDTQSLVMKTAQEKMPSSEEFYQSAKKFEIDKSKDSNEIKFKKEISLTDNLSKSKTSSEFKIKGSTKLFGNDRRSNFDSTQKSKPLSSIMTINVDTNISDVHDYVSDAESDGLISNIGKYKPYPKTEPFSFTPDESHPKMVKAPSPSIPSKFYKKKLRESDYESDYEGRIPSKWTPIEKEEEVSAYRKVLAPSPTISIPKEFPVRTPSPPSKFDVPPSFSGPPRPQIESLDIPKRQRRESLEEYSVPKFPQVEFKLHSECNAKIRKDPKVVMTDSETESYQQKQECHELSQKNQQKIAQEVVGHELKSMNLDFRNRAQKFANSLVSEVFNSKKKTEGSPGKVSSRNHTLLNGSEALRLPQKYNKESKVSKFGSKHIDPDTGLVYFKYDFGYEFGIIFPGKATIMDTKASSSCFSRDKNDIEIPVIHEKSDTEERCSSRMSDKSGHLIRSKFYDSDYDSRGVLSDAEGSRKLLKNFENSMSNKTNENLLTKLYSPELDLHSEFSTEEQSSHRKENNYCSTSGNESCYPDSTRASKSPTFIKKLQSIEIPAGGDVKLECEVISRCPSKISWHKDGNPLNTQHKCQTQFEEGICKLHLFDLQSGDSGNYTCTAENSFGQDSTQSYVHITPGETFHYYLPGGGR